jgi:hypothetical protein
MLGLILVLLGTATAALYTPPTHLKSPSGKQEAIVEGDKLILLKGTKRSFAVKYWMERLGIEEAEKRKD